MTRLEMRLATGGGTSILANIVMATSVHIPKPLLEAVDRRAHALRVSRNRLIVKALERELSEDSGWSVGFFEELGAANGVTVKAVDEMLDAVRARRRSKEPRRL